MDLAAAMLANEGDVRWYVILVSISGFAAWESLRPRRSLVARAGHRWSVNAALVVFNSICTHLATPVMGVAMAVVVEEHAWGLLNWLELPNGTGFVVAIVLLDVVRYGQHVAFHCVPVLWRLHAVHHSDVDYDCSTGLRFHPFEALLSQAVLLGSIVLIGPSPFAVLLFELMHFWVAFMSHANVRVPDRIERLARLVIVTPDMHRVHHSTVTAETNSNYGGLVSWWDRIFRNYRPEPAGGHERMTIGLPAFRDDQKLTFLRLLLMPFAREQKQPSPTGEGAPRQSWTPASRAWDRRPTKPRVPRATIQ